MKEAKENKTKKREEKKIELEILSMELYNIKIER